MQHAFGLKLENVIFEFCVDWHYLHSAVTGDNARDVQPVMISPTNLYVIG